MRKLFVLMVMLLVCVAGATAQTDSWPVVLRKVPAARLEQVGDDEFKLVLYTDRGSSSLRHLSPDFEIMVDRRQWMDLEDMLRNPSSRLVVLECVDGTGVRVVRATGVSEAGLQFYQGNKLAGLSESDFYYIGGGFPVLMQENNSIVRVRDAR